ncbi:hypothetical protein JCM21714_1890 [Gracilibacillus boraciitolerans JCM 21714]|uniref:Probable membrane transporter protein n=1 Tax=Gracilibacillus boraciitolerans JCM 21714 TaxID=1298598 RepID=W4VJC5_9BACI|nr:hypothetical protein JCM21714_1890 [Gracilibacillus boraciitolerans JCM 21714]
MLLIFSMFLFKKSPPSRLLKENQNQPNKIVREVKIGKKTFQYAFSPYVALLIAFTVGTLSGFFGIGGGGSLMVPAMILLFRFPPPHIATATSMFMILSLSIVSSVTHIALGHIEWMYVWAFIPGALLGGGILGAKMNQKMSSKAVEILLRLVLLFIGLRLIWQGLF